MPVIEVAGVPAETGERALYRASGCFSTVDHAVVIDDQVLDDDFTDAPTDWTGEGTWQATVRWACDARWSFLSGWSHGDVALWHKRRFSGDHRFDVFLAPKMEYPYARDTYAQRYRDLGVTLCGDGHDPRSGYVGILGVADEQGNINRRTVLMRNGVIVGSAPKQLPPKDEVHKDWFHLALVKHGSIIELWVGGAPIIRYDDPHPLDGGVPAVWTVNNGLSLARARLAFTTPPQPCAEPQLILDEPVYPEWHDIGTPCVLTFPTAYASTGAPVRLKVTPRSVPADETLPTVADTRVILTPQKVGEHWYQVNATDGAHDSPSAHVLLPVFNPALGRDDSRTLALYRFTEGRGTVVHDRGRANPPLNLDVLAPTRTRWIPGGGLRLVEPTMLRSHEMARKLMAIRRAGECTIESWLSYSTLYPVTIPPVFWEGCLCAWENGAGIRNFAFGYHSYSLLIAATPGADLFKFNRNTCWTPYNHIGLQHQVVTWRGDITTFYVNGRKVEEKAYRWQTTPWSADAPLICGNEPDGRRPFLGTYYLLAVHDRALTEAQVLRHYQAGPAAR